MADLPIGGLPVAGSINANAAFAVQQDLGSGQTTYQVPFSLVQTGSISLRVATNYTTAGERWIFVTDVSTAPTPRTITLSTVDYTAKAVITIKDETNTAATNNILIITQAGQTINNGPSSVDITSNGGSITLVSDGTTWESIIPDDTGSGGGAHTVYLSTAGGPQTYSLPSPVSWANKQFNVKDSSGNATANQITVDVTGGGNIDGSPNIIINVNYGIGRFSSNGTQWFTN